MSSSKIAHVPKQTALTPGETEIVLLVLTSIRSHVIAFSLVLALTKLQVAITNPPVGPDPSTQES